MLKIKWINTSNMLKICLAHGKCSMTICYCSFIFIVIRSRHRTFHMSFYWTIMTVLSGTYYYFHFRDEETGTQKRVSLNGLMQWDRIKLTCDLSLTWNLSRVYLMNVCMSPWGRPASYWNFTFRDLSGICAYKSQITTLLNTYHVPRSFQFSPVLISYPPVKAHYSHYRGKRNLVTFGFEAPWPIIEMFRAFPFFF